MAGRGARTWRWPGTGARRPLRRRSARIPTPDPPCRCTARGRRTGGATGRSRHVRTRAGHRPQGVPTRRSPRRPERPSRSRRRRTVGEANWPSAPPVWPCQSAGTGTGPGLRCRAPAPPTTGTRHPGPRGGPAPSGNRASNGRVVLDRPVDVLVGARQEAGPTGPARGGLGVVGGEPNALGGQAVQVWGLHHRVSRSPEAVASPLVEGDEQDVRTTHSNPPDPGSVLSSSTTSVRR